MPNPTHASLVALLEEVKYNLIHVRCVDDDATKCVGCGLESQVETALSALRSGAVVLVPGEEVEQLRELYSSALNDSLRKSKMYNEAVEQLEALLDVWDDQRYPLDSRCYVEGAFITEMETVRAMLAAAKEKP